MSTAARPGRRSRSSPSGDERDGGLGRDDSRDGAGNGVSSAVVSNNVGNGVRNDLGRPGDRGARGGRTRGSRGSAEADATRDRGPDADPESVARAIVLRQLTASARTRVELERTLAKRNVPDDAAGRVLDRMTEVGLIDDAEFAREWVRQRQLGKGLARRALADELRRKGVADDLAQAALGQVDDEAERSAAFELAARKARASRGQPHDKRLRSLAGMLARKGYPPGLAFAVTRDVLHAEGVEFDD